MFRYKIRISYLGTKYVGWQTQPNGISIQAKLEEALTIWNHGKSVKVTGAGRTDSGVHAEGQIAHFDLDKRANTASMLSALNGILPSDIRILDCRETEENFHARYDARIRIYRYRILKNLSPFDRDKSWYVKYPLDEVLLNQMADLLPGRHDFSFFSKDSHEIDDRHCTIYYAQWIIKDSGLIFEIGANRFIRSMVRMLVGAMVEVSRGRYKLRDFIRMLKEPESCTTSPVTAPAYGLTLKSVLYKEDFDETFYRYRQS